MKRVVVLVSGSGRNLQALLDHAAAGTLEASIVGVLSNRADAYALERARLANVPAMCLPHQNYPERADFDRALADAVSALAPDIVVMAGFMRVLGDAFLERFAGRMLNIHPSLLPRHPGLRTHDRVLEAGDLEHGATVHFVTPELDGGPRIIQGKFRVPAQHTAAMLAEKLMTEIELRIYPQAVAWFARGELGLEAGRVKFRGVPLDAPLSLQDLEDPFR